ncbi:MAG: MCT family MFS transporter [Candidatus Binataceae bacterium]
MHTADTDIAAQSADAAAIDAARDLARFDSARSWRMVAVAFVAMFTVYGIAYSFGAFFKPMAAEFGAGRSSTSAVFSLTVFVWCVLGWPAGHLSDRFGPRVVVGAGAIVMGGGLVLTAFIDRLWIGYLTYSLGVGIGIATAYVPMVAVVGGWFLRRRNSALGIAVAGIGCGTVLVAPACAALIERLGWRDTDLVLGVVATVLLLGCAAIAERPPVHVTPSAIDVRAAVRTPAFGLLYLNSFLSSMALFVPFVYLPAFAHDHGANEIASAALISIIGGASVIGRLGLGAIADRTSTIRLYQACYLLLAASFGLWLFGSSYATMVVFAIAMGTGYGGFVALSPAVLAELFGVARLGTVMGILYTSGGVGALLGPPIAGMIIDYTGSYRGAIAYSLVGALASFAVLIPLSRYSARPADILSAIE